MTWRDPVIRGSVLLMEAIWTYALVAFAIAAIADGGNASIAGVGAVVLFSYGISRFLQSTDLSLGVLRVWGTMASFLLFYAIVRVDFFGDWRLWDFSWANDVFNHTEDSMRENTPAVFGIPMLWCFWIRGVLRGQETATFESVVASFGAGVLIIAVVEAFQAQVEDTPSLVGLVAVPFVAFGLFAIGLAHSARAETDRGRPFERTLLTTMGFSILALALVAAVVALFDLATGWGAARDASAALVDVGQIVGNIILWPIEQVLNVVFEVIIWLRNLILGEPQPPQVGQGEQGEMRTCVQIMTEDRGMTMERALKECNPDPKHLPDWIKLLVRIIIATPFVGLAVLMTALMFSRFRKVRRAGELKESAYQQGRLASDLSDLWHNLLGRLRPNIHLGREHLDPVRRLYFEMLDDAEGRGISRDPGQTPDELAPSLERTFRGSAPGLITTAFDDVRYGSRSPSEQEARRLRDEWERLRQE